MALFGFNFFCVVLLGANDCAWEATIIDALHATNLKLHLADPFFKLSIGDVVEIDLIVVPWRFDASVVTTVLVAKFRAIHIDVGGGVLVRVVLPTTAPALHIHV